MSYQSQGELFDLTYFFGGYEQKPRDATPLSQLTNNPLIIRVTVF